MRHDLYQAETSRIAHEQGSLLGMAQQRLVESGQYKFITEFLLRPITVTGST